MTEQKLTLMQAYEAMYAYFSRLYDRYGTEELGTLLSEMGFLSDGDTADPAAWEDWLACVQKAVDGNVDTKFRIEGDRSTES